MRLDGKVIGALVLNASEAHVLDDDEMKLLAELAGDISSPWLPFENRAPRLFRFLRHAHRLAEPHAVRRSHRSVPQSHTGPRDKLAVILLDIERFSFINESLAGRQATSS